MEVEIDWGGEAILPPHSFDRLDYARARAEATIHPLVPTPRTTLRLAP